MNTPWFSIYRRTRSTARRFSRAIFLRKAGRPSAWFITLLVIAPSMTGTHAHAVRPFVTDDARIVFEDQLEVESWAQLNLERGQKPGFGLSSLQGYAPTDRLEIIAGGFGLEYQDKRITVENLVFQPKYLIHRSLDSWIPSISVAAAVLAPLSGNRQLWNSYAMFHASWFLFTPKDSSDPYDNGLAIHINAGTKSQYDAGLGARYTTKPFWAFGFEAATPISRDLRLVGEIFNGDPFFFEEEFPAFQSGLRWYTSPNVQWDVVFGGVKRRHDDPDAEGRGWGEFNIQIGYRQLFDFGG